MLSVTNRMLLIATQFRLLRAAEDRNDDDVTILPLKTGFLSALFDVSRVALPWQSINSL